MNNLSRKKSLWLELDCLWLEGEGESEMADRIREEMDRHPLTPAEDEKYRSWAREVESYYRPPSPTNWRMVGPYNDGWVAAARGKTEKDNPHKEGDTTLSDELHFHWWSGYHDFQKAP